MTNKAKIRRSDQRTLILIVSCKLSQKNFAQLECSSAFLPGFWRASHMDLFLIGIFAILMSRHVQLEKRQIDARLFFVEKIV